MHRAFLLCLFFISTLLAGCEDLFEYHPNEIRLKENERNLTHKNLHMLKEQAPSDTLKVLVMGDTQRFYDHIEDFVASARLQQGVHFMVHCGDISDFGLAQEFRWVHSLLKELPFPYLTVVGNHDLLANGRKIYKQMYGPLNYYFDVGRTRFVLLDANSREYNYNGKVPDINWLTQALQLPASVEEAVVVTHIPPYDADFDPSLEKAYAEALQKSKKVRLSLHGHQHKSEIHQPYGDDITYLVTTSMKGRGYAILKIWKEGYDVQQVVY